MFRTGLKQFCSLCISLFFLFQGLHAIACVFDHFLTRDPYSGWEDDGVGSQLVSCFTLSDPKYKPPVDRDDEDSFDEGWLLKKFS